MNCQVALCGVFLFVVFYIYSRVRTGISCDQNCGGGSYLTNVLPVFLVVLDI